MVEPLESVESAAKVLSLSPWTIRAYIREGKIRPIRIGRRVLIEPTEVRRLIEQGRNHGLSLAQCGQYIKSTITRYMKRWRPDRSCGLLRGEVLSCLSAALPIPKRGSVGRAGGTGTTRPARGFRK